MKILIAVTNCWMFRKRQEVIRNTWLKNVPSCFDVRFFLGVGPNQKPEQLKSDEVFCQVDDGYNGLPAKTRAMARFARDNGYDWMFKCDDDTYVQLDRLAKAVQELMGDYVGRLRGPSGNYPAPYASGFSYWLSRRAFSIIADAKLTEDVAEDRWVGNTLHNHHMGCAPDYRYVIIMSTRNALSHTEGPRAGNNIITACEFDADKWMNKLHFEWHNLASLAKTHRKEDQEQHPLRRVAVMVKTFLRDGYLFRCVAGIQQRLPESKIVIVDDGYERPEKITLYSKLRLAGHSCAWLPFDSGFGAKANEAVKHCDREYVLIGSDDFIFGHEHVRPDITRMVETLDQVPDLDIVSGRVNNNPYEALLEDRGDEVIERKGYSSEESCAAGTFKRCDLTVNYSLIRRTLLEKVRWDGDVKIGGGEHGMFYLDVKRAGGKVAYLPGVTISEFPGAVPGWFHADYGKMRARAREKGRPCALRRGVMRYWMGDTCEVSNA